MGKRLLGYILLGLGVLVTLAVLYINSSKSEIPLVFSPTQVLGTLWDHYEGEYIEQSSGRTLDKQRDNITTSEGQSYTMLRAVWMGDKTAFDHSWQWTKDNLDRPDDKLFSWLFGRKADGTYGPLAEQGGANTASDADQDIALALVFAYSRWQDPVYLYSARDIIRDIWAKEVISIAGKPYLAANDLEKFSNEDSAILNPSYLAPYAYRIFAQVDPDHPWESLVDSSYELLGRSMDAVLDSGKSAGLPPDWVRINKNTGALIVPAAPLTTNFGYDALRVPWRLGLDYQWYGDERAKALLRKMSFLSDTWRRSGQIDTTYSHAGTVVGSYETPAMYGGALGYFATEDPEAGKKIYEEKLIYLYDPDTNGWKDTLSYYDDNWAWFGIGLYNKLLPNLAASLPGQSLKP